MVKSRKNLYLFVGAGILAKLALMSSCVLFLFGCMVQTVPEYGIEIPKGIEGIQEVAFSIRRALTKEDWLIRDDQPGLIEAVKTSDKKSADIYIVYGYQGYSIEYADSDNMQYNAEQDTIDSEYRKWTGDLNQAIIHSLKESAHD